MKPASVIRAGDDFVTLRSTTDEPVEIREALEAHEILDVYKGDQNQAWDAVLANHCLARALGDDGHTAVQFFVQDEKLGTPDSYLARIWRQQGRRFALTEDYYRYRRGAVWEHQDVSYGLFYTEVVSPEEFASAAAHLHRLAAQWALHGHAIQQKGDFRRALELLGVSLDGGRSDEVTGLGPAVEGEAREQAFAKHADVALYYALTKSCGLYGLVPVEDDDVTLSSIPANDPELRRLAARLLKFAATGAIRSLGSRRQRRAVSERARALGRWAEQWLEENSEASVTDFQVAFGAYLTRQIFPTDRLLLDRATRFTQLPPEGERREPEVDFFFYLDLCLRYPQEFAGAYNEALNKVGFGLQRLKCDPLTGRFTPPFFVTYAPNGPGTPVYRYSIELLGIDRTTLTLQNPSGDISFEAAGLVESADDLFRALRQNLRTDGRLGLVGKAAPFAAELKRAPRALGLPRQGSKYTPMVDHLLSGLRSRGVLDRPDGILIRIGPDVLDRLREMGGTRLRLPKFLHGPFERETDCATFARGWRRTTQEAEELLGLLGVCEFGQHVHLVKIMAANSQGRDWRSALDSDPRLAKVVRQFSELDGWEALLDRLGSDVAPEAGAYLDRLVAEREQLLAERRRLREETPVELETTRAALECEMLVLYAAYVRTLWQRAESLPYLNDRPYTLALYLTFGPEVFPSICRQVEFDLEFPSRAAYDI